LAGGEAIEGFEQIIARERLKLKQLTKKKSEKIYESLKLDGIGNGANLDKAIKKAKTFELFPVAGITLGETGSIYLSLSGKNCGIKDDAGNLTECYEVKGISFYCNENKVADKLHLTTLSLEGMPPEWTKIGFGWDLSYNEWVNLFKQNGYPSVGIEKPRVATDSGDKFLKAQLLTIVKIANGTALITLNFDYGIGKTTVNHRGTLFSIEVDKLS